MPKIPLYEQTGQRTERAGASYSLAGERISPLRIPRYGRDWTGFIDFANQVTNIGERMVQAERVEEFSKATVSANEQISNLLQQIKTDPELINASPDEVEDFYHEQTAEIKSNITQAMRSAPARDEFATRFDDKTISTLVKVRDLARHRMISRGRASTDDQLDALVNNMVETGDEKTLAEGLSIIKGKVAAGFFSPEEGEQLVDSFNRRAVKGYWNRRILDNPVLAYEILKENPSSLKLLDANDKTDLIARAKRAADLEGRDQVRNAVYGELKRKYGDHWGKAIDYLEDPKHYKSLDLESRRYLINTFAAERSRAQSEYDRYRNEKGRQEYDQVVELMKDRKYDEAMAATEASEFISPDTKARIYSALTRGDEADATDPKVYSSVVQGIHQGKIQTPDQVNQFRLAGLSNTDADKLVGKLAKPRYKAVLDYAEDKYKTEYPSRDDFELYNKWLEFVQHIDAQLEEAEARKGAMLTFEEGKQIVHEWLDPQVEVRRFWWDSEYVPFFEPEKYEAQKREEAKGLEGIPEPVQNRISQILMKQGYQVTPANIETFFNNNREMFEGE